ncbi:hypothetical protein NDU88_010577 [Pleurodeles waltl]|uniref:Uncharacterized protein n=1 Tax=Pleurodeles waltl TaxID=8319 RepID=A0AAV7QUR3_PLEWA|nr:hypothetical protein NDU88_010577 [Pleurodeles waltl]
MWLGASTGRGRKSPDPFLQCPRGTNNRDLLEPIKEHASDEGGEDAEVKSGAGRQDAEEKEEANQGRDDQDLEAGATKETRPGEERVAEEEKVTWRDPGDVKEPTTSKEGHGLTRYVTACAIIWGQC